VPWRSRFIGDLRGATDGESQQPRHGLAIDTVIDWIPITNQQITIGELWYSVERTFRANPRLLGAVHRKWGAASIWTSGRLALLVCFQGFCVPPLTEDHTLNSLCLARV
jgi:hypothetical protein